MTKETMISNYRTISGANSYILGFVVNHQVFAVAMNEVPPRYMSYEKASRNQGMNLRLRLKKCYKEQLLKKAFFLGEENELTATRYNKGENFERMITEYYGQQWEKDSKPFTDCGDITIDGIEYQIKFDGATFTNEKTLKNQRARLK